MATEFLAIWWFHGDPPLSADALNERLVAQGLVEPDGDFVTTWLDGAGEQPDRSATLSVTDVRSPIEVDDGLVVVEVSYVALDGDGQGTELSVFVELASGNDGWKVEAVR